MARKTELYRLKIKPAYWVLVVTGADGVDRVDWASTMKLNDGPQSREEVLRDLIGKALEHRAVYVSIDSLRDLHLLDFLYMFKYDHLLPTP